MKKLKFYTRTIKDYFIYVFNKKKIDILLLDNKDNVDGYKKLGIISKGAQYGLIILGQDLDEFNNYREPLNFKGYDGLKALGISLTQ